jgi:hypothetical protein
MVGDKDVNEINAEPGKFKLMDRKKGGCENYCISIKPNECHWRYMRTTIKGI